MAPAFVGVGGRHAPCSVHVHGSYIQDSVLAFLEGICSCSSCIFMQLTRDVSVYMYVCVCVCNIRFRPAPSPSAARHCAQCVWSSCISHGSFKLYAILRKLKQFRFDFWPCSVRAWVFGCTKLHSVQSGKSSKKEALLADLKGKCIWQAQLGSSWQLAAGSRRQAADQVEAVACQSTAVDFGHVSEIKTQIWNIVELLEILEPWHQDANVDVMPLNYDPRQWRLPNNAPQKVHQLKECLNRPRSCLGCLKVCQAFRFPQCLNDNRHKNNSGNINVYCSSYGQF